MGSRNYEFYKYVDNMDGISTITSIFIFLSALIILALQNAFEHYDFMIILGIMGGLN